MGISYWAMEQRIEMQTGSRAILGRVIRRIRAVSRVKYYHRGGNWKEVEDQQYIPSREMGRSRCQQTFQMHIDVSYVLVGRSEYGQNKANIAGKDLVNVQLQGKIRGGERGQLVHHDALILKQNSWVALQLNTVQSINRKICPGILSLNIPICEISLFSSINDTNSYDFNIS